MANEVVYNPTLMDSLDDDTTALPMDFDPDADAYAPPPPLPDGWYQATLSCTGVKDENGLLVPFKKRSWGSIKETFHTSIQAKVIDPGGVNDGKYATDSQVITFPDPKQHHTSRVATIYRGITGKTIPGATEGQQMKALIQELQSNPTVWIQTQLEGQAADAGKAFSDAKKAQGRKDPVDTNGRVMKAPKTFKGQKAFMEDGKLTGRVYDAATQEIVVGRPQIIAVRKERPVS